MSNHLRVSRRKRSEPKIQRGTASAEPSGATSTEPAVANTQKPFAWAISGDNRTILGADMDGYFNITLITPGRMEKCYTQNGTSPSRSIVAACYEMDRIKH